MKKLLWIFVILFLVTFGLISITYSQSIKPLKSAEQKAIKKAFLETRLKTVDDFELYHGLETVSIVKGKNVDGEKIIVWIPENGNEPIVRKEKNGVTKQQAINKVKQLSNPQKIVDVRLGMEKGIPLWEIYYLSDSNLINYYYVDFETGEWLKKIENL
ncbi:cell wall elongation regulator TseB-like domain-containing protein [Neobacillus sp. D3-1R]|uniref:cell wall elongation regulator TseB-like domain-containing protein n=1 Tax=Neobacillus sp. D3-1R TaxID=3445778 RepID=UPI003FA0736E